MNSKKLNKKCKNEGYSLTCAVCCSNSTVTLETVFPVPTTAPRWAAKFPS